ncbi:piggyBac transposable element-derived protein 2-like [Alosa sapidissima]|uniref:piggyBac transposable element-derived protein 2-like n=1 Tax=Alosa sapidissima TaxID=34773 RepID=UPI001C097590|nr:piggyBac transposable element-derived protein 2-like [Alosa sapidissima]
MVREPIEYFESLLGRDVFEDMATQTNLYAVQEDPNKPLNASVGEIQQFFGICLYMSVYGLPYTRMYWGKDTRVDKVSDVMSLSRWEAMKRFLHLADNSDQVAEGQPGFDKLFKVRPFLNALLRSFQDIPMNEMLCVDEQIVPFKGRSGLKTYNPKKPKRWGYKVFVLADQHGIVHNFEFYTGAVPAADGMPDIGASGNVVLRLASVIPPNMSHKLFYDNWFCGVDLQVTLEKSEIHSVGTVRKNRLAGCIFTEDKEMKAKGRGTFEEMEAKHDGVTLKAVKWYDNRSVILLSTFAAANPTSPVQRWDKKAKEMVTVPRPNIVTIYNKSMGGVDLLDSLIALYRTKIRSKKWYHRIVFHLLDLTVVQAWFLYRRDSDAVGIPQKMQLSLLDFKVNVALCLTQVNKGTMKRKGRPSQSLEIRIEEKRHRGPTSPLPPSNIRLDRLDHWPEMGAPKGRCKNPGCKGIIRVVCSKCKVHLCCNGENNCFKALHIE